MMKVNLATADGMLVRIQYHDLDLLIEMKAVSFVDALNDLIIIDGIKLALPHPVILEIQKCTIATSPRGTLPYKKRKSEFDRRMLEADRWIYNTKLVRDDEDDDDDDLPF